MPSTYLISRALDPLFALGVGIWAYGLYEREHPRRPNHALHELLVRRYPALAATRDKLVGLWPQQLSSSPQARVDAQQQPHEQRAEHGKLMPSEDGTPVGLEKARR
ncbi:hypothetical protein BCR37DRAFT_390549 [Protomyces lactucae-debilis]|uniref:Uncharacterized protein n=1 Tax=Protomyces lactucae-debilis TaxID=2754530 RepID=A0A1Y2FS24_PROLT|nr:uncharacterized protein BCR37DRAFT_390549 [Protomyces lactucae-debilis]ORY86810.1 hypothetical protein BCR37DRAFT_390549 [Protomyces lactucae-debilis]